MNSVQTVSSFMSARNAARELCPARVEISTFKLLGPA